jgi:hypothetical protein
MDKDKELQNLWNFYSEILRRRGVDLPHALKQWATTLKNKLPSPGAHGDFGELCTNGCVAEILAILLESLRWSPKLEDFWSKFYGSPKARHRVRKNLEKTANATNGLFELLISFEGGEVTSMLWKINHIGPGRLVAEMRFYAKLLNLTDSISRETQAKSLRDFCMFTLVRYTKLSTRRFCDRNVSGLIAEVIGPVDYNEVAHRMWRFRNFKRMDSQLANVSELLADIHTLAISET